MSLVQNIARTYRAPRKVVAWLIAQDPREPQVLMFMMLACALIFVSQWPVLSRAAYLDPSVTFQQRMGGALFGIMFLLPLLLYGLAGLMQLGLRLVSGKVVGLHVRLVLFWSLLAVTPLTLLRGGLSAFLGTTPAVAAFGFVVLAVFLYILGAGLSVVVRSHPPEAGKREA